MAEGVHDDLELKPAEAGTAFRLEMFVTDFALRYWTYAVAAVVAGLLAVLIYGMYRQSVTSGQRHTTAAIATETAKLPAPLPMLIQQVAQGETIDLAQVEAVGDGLVAIANGASGAASVEARLTAAEAFRLVGNKAKQREALERALGEADGVLAYSAESALANLDLEEGRPDDAVAHLEKLSKGKDFLAEQSTLDLGLAYETLGRKEDAVRIYADFLTRFPTSTRASDVKARQARVSP